jgi:hypothetical protein
VRTHALSEERLIQVSLGGWVTVPRELAECLTIIDQVMLKAIPPKELVRKVLQQQQQQQLFHALNQQGLVKLMPCCV